MENKHKCERKVRESWETFNLLPQSMCSLHGNIWEIKLKFGFVRSNLCIQSINSYSVDRKMKPAAPFQTVRPENEKAQKYYNLHQHFFFFTASNNQKITWDQLLHINTPLHKKPKEKKKEKRKKKKARDDSAASSSNPSNQWFTKLCMLSLLRGFRVTLSGYAILSITLTVFHKAEKLRSRCGVQISS